MILVSPGQDAVKGGKLNGIHMAYLAQPPPPLFSLTISQVTQAYYDSPEQHYPAQLINYSYDNSYKTLFENYPISP